MAMDHTNCDHPRTPAGRAACRKAQAAHVNFAITHAEATKPHTRPKADPKPRRTKATWKADRLDATRILRANADTKDLPHPFRSAVAHAWKLNHTVHTGTPYTAAQRVVELRSERGTVYLTWACNNPHGVTKVSWRAADTSIFNVVPSINEALRLLDGV